MAKTGYSAPTGGAVSLAADTAKSVIGVKGHANFGIDLVGFRVGFIDVNAAEAPVIVELCYATFATNSPGTNSTSVTPAQIYGRATTVGATAGRS